MIPARITGKEGPHETLDTGWPFDRRGKQLFICICLRSLAQECDHRIRFGHEDYPDDRRGRNHRMQARQVGLQD
jgi:hypothetical protein